MKKMVLLLLCSTCIYSSDIKKESDPPGVYAPLPRTVVTDYPCRLVQTSENYLEYRTDNGKLLQFKVKLVVHMKPNKREADVAMGIFQGEKLVTSRTLEFYW